MAYKNKDVTKSLAYLILQGILEKKGHEIVTIDLRKLDSSICDYFIICHGTSNTQVDAIAESVQKITKENININPLHKEGQTNSQWILLDYASIVVHIFQQEYRSYYKLEDLWGDGIVQVVDDENKILKEII